MPGTDSELFGLILRYLGKKYKDRGCEPAAMRKLIKLVGEVERVFLTMPLIEKEEECSP